MNKPAIITAALTVTAAAVAVALPMNVCYNQLYVRFPNFDRKIIRKAYNKMMLDAIMQKVHCANLDDWQMDVMFLTYVTKVIV